MQSVVIKNERRLEIMFNNETRVVEFVGTSLDAYVVACALMVHFGRVDGTQLRRMKNVPFVSRKRHEVFVLHENVVTVPFYTADGVSHYGFMYVVPANRNFVDDVSTFIARTIFMALHHTSLYEALLIDDTVSISNIKTFSVFDDGFIEFDGERRRRFMTNAVLERKFSAVLRVQHIVHVTETLHRKDGWYGKVTSAIIQHFE